MKGIILAGGTGSRLYPITESISKQLLPIYDKPMIYYPISVLMLADIRDILIITTPQDYLLFSNLLGDGSQWGINLSYKMQDEPNGIAEAFIVGEEFIGNDSVCLILGDNIFYGQGFTPVLKDASTLINGATIFGYQVTDPERFGVVEFDENSDVVSIEEKPQNPKSNHAITGLYFYDNDVISIAKNLVPSSRGELEISDINKEYLRKRKLKVIPLGRGFTWLDTGTFESLIEAGQFVQIIEKRQGNKIACLEEISYKNGWISKEMVLEISRKYKNNNYGKYLIEIIKEGN
ncbi:glucose-1-phosphate thymidylyltransferase [Bacillus coahuilensis p1.1.43]|uniref:Glucose-1-phosphate thymidylyltransferase n=1 Tax=Bacillus coahuilensis p1.1.43 TaxID=1150625 RepID=A0A147K5Y3_9BACI|nr:glucose-1-phosphate thymidylyltransferase RfbA [Bacillus coahuilensis]KUP05256.1 glucose-1-phosphate thymidylyltransferase [Bacillus coahuilensis p1.1.43]